MGTVRKQSIHSFFFIIIGFALGAINTLFLYTKFLSTEEYGLTGVFRDFLSIFSVLCTFGSTTALYKFFPLYYARLGREKNDLPFLILLVSFIGCAIFTLGCFVFKDLIIRKFSANSPLFVHHFYLVIPLTICALFISQLEGFAFMLKRTAMFNLVKETGFRIIQTIIIVLYAYDYISIDTFFLLFSLMYVPSLIIMIVMISYKKGIKLNFKISKLSRKIYRKVISFSLFHFSGGVIAFLPFALNGILITSISDKGLEDTGVYTIATFMVSMLDVPLRGMRGIGVATYSEAFLNNDMERISRMQKSASLSLFIVGFCIFGLLLPNIENLVYFSKGEDFHPVIYIFFIVGIAKLIEMSMGMNDSLLSMSKKWKTDFFISTSVVVLSIPVNILFIKWNPLLGAAIGQSIILILFCIARMVAVWIFFRTQPFSGKTIVILLIGSVATMVAYYIPPVQNIFIDILLRGGVFLLLYAVPMLYFNISQEMTDIFLIVKRKVLRK